MFGVFNWMNMGIYFVIKCMSCVYGYFNFFKCYWGGVSWCIGIKRIIGNIEFDIVIIFMVG